MDSIATFHIIIKDKIALEWERLDAMVAAPSAEELLYVNVHK
jgi:hypothetical protein